MKNLNYPFWESGIPDLLPEMNPYLPLLHTEYMIQVSNGDWIYPLNDFRDYKHINKRDKWSYMEILQWLRDKGYYINVNVLVSGEYIGSLFQFIEDSYKTHYELGYIKYRDYYEALDEAIIYTLKSMDNDK